MKVNDRVYADTKENVFVTITYGILDTHEAVFRFVRAGHEPVVTVDKDDGQVRLSSPPGMAMGLVGSDMFGVLQEQSLKLNEGNTAVLYTDGVVEAMDPSQNEYGQQRFFDLIAANRTSRPKEIIEKTLQDIREFTKGYPQHDDITLLAIRVTSEAVALEQQQGTMPSAGI